VLEGFTGEGTGMLQVGKGEHCARTIAGGEKRRWQASNSWEVEPGEESWAGRNGRVLAQR